MSAKRKLGVVATDAAADEERQMEEFLFGKNIVATKPQWEDMEEAVQFSIDTEPTAVEDNEAIVAPAWHDDDDENVVVDLDQTSRLKRLKFSKKASGGRVVSGAEFSTLLKERFQSKAMDWTTVALDQAPRNELLDDDDYDLLQQTGGMVGRKQNRGVVPLPAEKLRIQRVLDGNHAEPSASSITATCFHRNSERLLVASEDKGLRLFKVDHETNPTLTSLKFKDMMVRSASFLDTRDEIVATGRKPYFYVYNTSSGQMSKLPGPTGEQNLQHLSMSPEGFRMSVLGSSGYVHIADAGSKMWVDRVKMNGTATSARFMSDNLLVTSNNEATVYLWDLRYGKTPVSTMTSPGAMCAAKFGHDDGTETSSLSVFNPHSAYAQSPSHFALDSSYIAVGTASGVVSLFQGVEQAPKGTNYYPLHARTENTDEVGAGLAQVKTIMNLTTRISATAFHPSGQILAIGSYEKKDQLKLVHLPTNTVFSNWPVADTPLHTIETLEFSPDGHSLAVGNKRGKVLIFQMPHFMDQQSRRSLRTKKRMN